MQSIWISCRIVKPSSSTAMESCSYFHTAPFASPAARPAGKFPSRVFHVFLPEIRLRIGRFPAPLSAMRTPKGFGPSLKNKKKRRRGEEQDSGSETDDDDDNSDGTIPEIVTNRMMSRMGVSVGIPLGIGLLFFPFFYYLKVVLKLDVPTWVPVIVSFFFFGSALLGVSYGIVSSSWDPLREGSLLGWKEAQRNWPVFWQSLWGRTGKK